MGIGAQSGTIKVVIDVRGQGDGAAVVDKNAKALKGLKEEATGLKGIGESLKGATSGINSLGGGLAGVRMGMMGIPGAVGAIIGTVGALGAAIVDAFRVDVVAEFKASMAAAEQQIDHALSAMEARIGKLRAGTGTDLGKSLGTQDLEGASKIQVLLDDQVQALRVARAERENQIVVSMELLKIDRDHAENLRSVIDKDREIYEIVQAGVRLEHDKNKSIALQAIYKTQAIALEVAHGFEIQKNAVSARILANTMAPLAMINALGAQAVADKKARPVGRGGGVRTPEREPDNAMTLISDRARQVISDAKGEVADKESGRQAAIKRRDTRDLKAFRAANDNAADEEGISAEAAEARAQGIRDISSAIMESIPALDQYAGALGKITDTWAEYAKTSEGMGAAVATTIGGLAKVSAQQIKDERARAGVLAAINFGLFLASEFVPGMQAQAGGYLAGSIALGVVAATGIGTGGGASGGGAGAARNTPRTSLVRNNSGGGQSNGPIVLNIGVLAGGSPQENAESIGRILDRRRAA